MHGPRPTNPETAQLVAMLEERGLGTSCVHDVRRCPKTVRLRLAHPDVAYYVDVTLTEHEGRWLATAMLADEPDICVANDPREALRAALAALGEPSAFRVWPRVWS